METSIGKGSHPSTLHLDAAAQLRQETLDKVAIGQAQVVTWEFFKDNSPKELKISPIVIILHVS